MKSITLSLFIVLSLLGCGQQEPLGGAAEPANAALKIGEEPQIVIFLVEGMKCAGCENNIQIALLALPGVSEVTADRHGKTVKVTFDPQKSSLINIKNAFPAGFQVVGERNAS